MSDSERVRTLAAKIAKEIASYAAKKKVSGQSALRSVQMFSVTTVKRVINPRFPSEPPHPRMEEVREGKEAWIVGVLSRSGNAKQLCVDPDGRGYLYNPLIPRQEPEQLTIGSLNHMNETQLEEIYELIAKAR